MKPYLLLVAVMLVQPWPARPQQPPQDKNIFILGGQSNMVGLGGVVKNGVWDGFVPPECSPNPSIMKLNAQLEWVEASEPLHKDIDMKDQTGIGPGMPFANRVLEKQPGFGVVGLVPCAVGGTSISEWERGKQLYNEMMKRATASLRDGGSIRALLWYQGEADTVNLTDAQSYQRRLLRFFSDVRADLQSPMLPIVQVALASGWSYLETVRQAQLGIDLPNLRTVDAKGLPLEPDVIHLTTEAQVRLGQTMADAFLQFLPTPVPEPSVAPVSSAARQYYSTSTFAFLLPFLFIFLTMFLY